MQLQQQHEQEALRRVQAFLDTHDSVVGPLKDSEARKQLDDAVAKLAAHTLDQGTARLEASGTSAASASARRASSHRPSRTSRGTRPERNFASHPWWPTLRARPVLVG